jgi:26S proteasome regulatory subunit N10
MSLQLALKHRQNKSQRQRIIVFSCSPIVEDEKSLVKLAKRLKKININVDIIAFGEPSEDTVKKLTSFNEAVKSADSSYFGVIPPGPNLLSDTLLATPLLANEGVGGTAGQETGDTGGGGQQFEFGVNPEVDPELALALRMSYEEEKARQEREKAKEAEDAAKSKLDDIPEADEKTALLSVEDKPKDDDLNPDAASSSSSSKKPAPEGNNRHDPDDMDTA